MLDLSKYENLYDNFDAGHGRRHMEAVRKQAVELANKYAHDKVELAYIAATLHDFGISKNREDHEKNGEEMILADKTPPDSTSDALLRGYNFGLKYFPKLTVDEQLLRVSKHLTEKFNKESVDMMVFFPETAQKIEAIFTKSNSK